MTAPLPRLMVAPNGARRGKADHPALPITIEETVETAVACQQAGAGGIHVHVRDKNGRHSLDAGLYREALSELSEAVPTLFLQVTSEAGGRYDAAAQGAMIRDLRPASVSVALREMLANPSERDDAQAFYYWAMGEGVGVHHIVYSPDELRWLLACLEEGLIPGRWHQLQLVLGSYTGTELPRPADLDGYLSLIEPQQGDHSFDWMLCAFGTAETSCLVEAARRGGKMRVGFENSLWNADGSLAKDNAERVAEVCAALDTSSQTLSPEER